MDSNLSGPPRRRTATQGETVDRLLYASECRVLGSVFEEMHRIRDHALLRNVTDDVYAALLYQAGWFVEWLEGPAQGIDAVLRRTANDPRHGKLRVLHRSRGTRRLTQPWSMAFRQDEEQAAQFERRVKAVSTQPAPDPATVWRRLSMPVQAEGVAGGAGSDRYQRVMVCAARGTLSFELVRWLGQVYGSKVTSLRLAGAMANSRDVASDYVDLDGGRGAVLRRVVATARNGLQIGLLQAFLSDYSHIIVLLCGDSRYDAELLHLLVAACARLSHRPVLLGLGGPSCDHAALREVARGGGLVYLDCDIDGATSAKAMWAAAEPALDLSRTTNSQW
ncbi:MAG TPA: BLUF domain-containing protein [Ramlibacter sp.]|nr:BLUF domain-containing protein [Ramlibacter sp.]